MILALDLATKTGWAYRNRSGKIVSGIWDFTSKRGEWNDKRYADCFHKLDGVCHKWLFGGVEDFTIWYEEPTPQSTDARKVLYGLLAVVKIICHEYDITLHLDKKVTKKKNKITGKIYTNTTYRGVAPKTLKKFTTGYGNASKADMMVQAGEIVGKMIDDDNEADAICLLAYAEEELCRTK